MTNKMACGWKCMLYKSDVLSLILRTPVKTEEKNSFHKAVLHTDAMVCTCTEGEGEGEGGMGMETERYPFKRQGDSSTFCLLDVTSSLQQPNVQGDQEDMVTKMESKWESNSMGELLLSRLPWLLLLWILTLPGPETGKGHEPLRWPVWERLASHLLASHRIRSLTPQREQRPTRPQQKGPIL